MSEWIISTKDIDDITGGGFTFTVVQNLVRCENCIHRPLKPDDYNPITSDGFALEFPDEICPCQCSDGWYSKYPADDWFCPRGEKKSE